MIVVARRADLALREQGLLSASKLSYTVVTTDCGLSNVGSLRTVVRGGGRARSGVLLSAAARPVGSVAGPVPASTTSAPPTGLSNRKADRAEVAARDDAIVAAYGPDVTMNELAGRFGVSRQRVHQILTRRGVVGRRMVRQRAEREQAERAEREAAERLATLLQRMATARPCRVCGCWVLRGPKTFTCSRECALAWRVARYDLDEEYRLKHRVHHARTILRQPELYRPAEVRLAELIVAGAAPPPNRRFVVPGSKSSTVAAAYRPELGEVAS